MRAAIQRNVISSIFTFHALVKQKKPSGLYLTVSYPQKDLRTISTSDLYNY
jgi:hypothetical protein